MIKEFESIISTLLQPGEEKDTFSLFDPAKHLLQDPKDKAGTAQTLNAAFLITLAGETHPKSERARRFISRLVDSSEWQEVAKFYTKGVDLIHREIEDVCKHDPEFSDRLKTLSRWMSHKEAVNNTQETTEKIWSIFFPEAEGILENRPERVRSLRAKRTVTITELNTTPITDPGKQILFTSNVLLTIPPASRSPEDLPFSDQLKEKLIETIQEPQLYFYDHPIRVGDKPEKNELLHGLRGLEAAFEFERDRGTMSGDTKPICILSVSVTHRGLQGIARQYIQEEFLRSAGLKNIDVYVFTEADTSRIIHEILAPAALHYLHCEDPKEPLMVFGVNGKYGRHYSFLKAIAPFWNIFIQPEIRATFKIDLDQVFPQKELVEQTGASAFEHFKTPLWGAHGLDSNGEPVELGMIAGALVNQGDIAKSLFTPDVPFPNRTLSADEYIFFSQLPQCLSTESEMMTHYNTEGLDGKRTCLQRIHVTGGTNGILVDSLRRYRPFTPSFIGRAEDQAYILSVLPNPGTKLGYIHKDGLIMRHDMESCAQEATQSISISKLLGDYVRILYFSAYAKALTDDVPRLKDTVDPFTGCFISRIPTTVVYLRLALRAASLFAAQKEEQGVEFIKTGAKRIMNAHDFVYGEDSMLKQHYKKECLGWNLYYDTLSALEHALKNGDGFALKLREKAEGIIEKCSVGSGSR